MKNIFMDKQFYFKKVIVLLAIFLVSGTVNKLYAQGTGSGIFFQAVARDGFSNPAKDRKIIIETSLIQSSASGTVVLREYFTTTTDASGVFSVSIGEGTRLSGAASNLQAIEWSKGPFFLNLKVAISPIITPTTWDYTKDLVDLGTSPFGAVPYALFAASVAGFDTKVNVSDTAKMLLPYTKLSDTSKMLSSYTRLSDTSKMLLPYARVNDLNSLVTNKVNIADSITKYVTPTQLAAKTFDQAPITNAIATKLNIADSITKYITPTQLGLKANTADVNTSLGLKANLAEVNSALGLKANITDVNSALGLKANSADVTSSLALKANTTDLNSALVLKENIANKSISVSSDGTSDTKYPSVKSVKDYVDVQIAGATIADANASTKGKLQLAGDLSGTAALPVVANNAITTSKIIDGAITTTKIVDANITTSKIADASVTDAKITTVSGAKVVGNIAGNAGTATKIATPVTINGVAFDGSSNITISSAAANSLTLNASGVGENSGVTFDGSAAKTISYNTIGASPLAGSPSLTSVGTITSGVWNGTAITIANGGTGASNASNARANLGLTIGTDVMSATATTTLTGDVSGTGNGSFATTVNSIGGISAGTIAGLPTLVAANTVSITANTNSITTEAATARAAEQNLTTSINANTASITSNTLAINTEAATARAAEQTLTTNVNANTVSITAETTRATTTESGLDTRITANTFSITTNTSSITTINTTLATKAPLASPTLTGVPTAPTPLIGDNSTTIATTEFVKANLATVSAGTLTGTTLASTITGSNLTSVGTITSGTWSGTEIAIANGGTGATTTSGALINLGAEASANKSTDINADAASVTKYPTVKTIKDYVDTRVASAAVADGSLTNAKLINSSINIGSTNVALGATTSSLSGLSSVTSTNFTGNLIGDVSGNVTGNASTATKLAATKNINSVPFDGSNDITIAAASNTLSGTTLASNVTSSSLTEVGTITSGTWSASTIDIAHGGTGSTTKNFVDLTNSQTIAGAKTFSNQVTLPIIGFNNGTAAWQLGGDASSTNFKLTQGGCCGRLEMDNLGRLAIGANYSPSYQLDVQGDGRFTQALTAPTFIGALTGNATTATTAGNITATSNSTLTSIPSLTSVGTISSGVWSGTSIAYNNLALTGGIVDADINSSAAIADTKLATITTSGKVSNSATTATHVNTANAIVARDASGNFTAGTITGTLSGTSSTANKLTTAKNINNVAFDGSADITIAAASNTLTGTTLASNVTSSSLTGVGTITSGTWSATTIDIAHGGTGATTVAGAISNLGLNSVVNTSLGTWSGTTNITTVGSLTAIGKTFMFQDLILGYGNPNSAKISTDASNKYLSFNPNYNIESTRMWPTGNVTIQHGGTYTDNGYTLDVQGSVSAATVNVTNTGTSTSTTTGALVVAGGVGIAGNVNIGGSINAGTWSGTTIAIANGGTGATTVNGTKTNLGLNNVENTALTTWTGSTNITSVGSLAAAGKTFTFQDLVLGSGTTVGKISTDDGGNKPLSFFPNYNVESTRFWGNGNVTIQTGGNYVNNGYKLEVAGTTKFVGNSNITGNLDVSGNITSATWSGTAIDVAHGGTGSSAKNFVDLTTSQTIAGAKTFSNTTTFNSDAIISGTASATSFTGPLTGNASTATKLAATKNINGVAFDGSTDITINTNNALTFNNGGSGDASGVTFNGSAAKTISYNSIGASPLAGSTSLTTVGTITSGTWSGTTIGSNFGGAGSVSGLMKANGSGVVSAAVAGTDYFDPTGSKIKIGYVAGGGTQGAHSIAIGANAAQSNTQEDAAVAIGYAAGQNGQGANSVAIGAFAGNSQVANSIALNASGSNLNPANSGFYVDPIRSASSSNYLFYNSSTKEISYNAIPTLNQNTTGSAATLTTSRNINGVAFNGSTDISINTNNALTFNNGGNGDATGGTFNGSAAKTISYNSIGASPLAGSTSLTTVGTITSGTWSGTTIGSNFGGAGSVSGLMKANGSGVVSAAVAGTDYQSPFTNLTNIGSISNAAGYLKNIGTGTFTYVGSITDADLSTIATSGKVANSATTATSANTASAIVARDASGNFTAGTITGTSLSLSSTIAAGAATFSSTINVAGASTLAGNTTVGGTLGVTGLTTLSSLVVPTITGGSSTTQPLTYKTTSGVGVAGADHVFLVGNNGGTEAMRVTNAGNVGIGTNAPSAKLHVNGDIIASSIAGTSDARYKINVKTIENPIDKIKKLRGVSFNWNQKAFPDKNFGEQDEIGFIAQEVEKVVPEVVTKEKNKEEYRAVKYDKMVALLIEGMKEQQKQIDSLKNEIKSLKTLRKK